MLKKITWQEGKVLSLKLRDNLFTLAQMRKDYYLQFFDIKNTCDEWSHTNLDEVNTLFFIFTSTKALKNLVASELSSENVFINKHPVQRVMLSAIIGGNYGANLIKLNDSLEEYDASILKRNLTLEDDLDKIYKYELSGMIGDPEKLRNRLINYFDNGINWDESKAFLFKGISPPHAKN